jgi:hypothetical protein
VPHPLRAELEKNADRLVTRLAGLPELAMRSVALAETLASFGALQSVWTLETLIRGALEKRAGYDEVYAALVDPDVVAGSVEAEHLDAMLRAGRAEGCVAAVQWLLSGSAPEGQEGPESDSLIDQELKSLTLGDRRARARRATGDAIHRLAVDPDPGVITNLLNNPRVTETVVLAICSRRPTVSPALEAVLRSPRWLRRYKVKLALARNPYLSQKFALNLLPTLNRPDLVSVRDDESLAPTLRLAAQRLLDVLV